MGSSSSLHSFPLELYRVLTPNNKPVQQIYYLTLAYNQLADLYTFMLYTVYLHTPLYSCYFAHSLVLIGSRAIVPAGPATTLLSMLLTTIGTHTGSLSCMLI